MAGWQERRCPPICLTQTRGLPLALFLLDFGTVVGGLVVFPGGCGIWWREGTASFGAGQWVSGGLVE